MYPLRVLGYSTGNALPDRLIRLLGDVTHTHVALQVGEAVAHVAVGDTPKWVTRRTYDKVLGNPETELYLGTFQGNLTNLHAHLFEVSTQRATIWRTLWHHYIVGGMHPGCTQLTCALLQFINYDVPMIPNPDTLLEYLQCPSSS